MTSTGLDVVAASVVVLAAVTGGMLLTAVVCVVTVEPLEQATATVTSEAMPAATRFRLDPMTGPYTPPTRR